ncbi:MAG: thymidine kinase [Candidatus Woesearchaeota archaeon]|nr:thymidine kinase [Candidatus Woesearchaeota archaeon]MDN5327842.1 thymidine kinase [Candidatus Woesearchaeota archaeon]
MTSLTITPFFNKYMIYGPPKSGKSGEVINSLLSLTKSKSYDKKDILVVKHFLEDVKHPNHIVSFDKKEYPAKEVEKPKDIEELINRNPKVELVFISGINFFEDLSIKELVQEIADSGRKVIMSGIPLTHDAKPYNHMDKLMAISHEFVSLYGVCEYCGEPATKSGKLDNEKYCALCSVHVNFEDRPDYNHFLINQKPLLRLIIGPMYASKTETLLDYINEVIKRNESNSKNETYTIFKAKIDNRYMKPNEKPKVKSHNLREFEAIPIKDAKEIEEYLSENKDIRHIFIDEGQFINGLYDVVVKEYYRGAHITISALARDFRGEPFGDDIPKLLTHADEIINRRAYCTHHIYNNSKPCRSPATETQRYLRYGNEIVPAKYDDPVVIVGSKGNENVKEFYEAVCPRHHEVLNKPKPKFEIEPLKK